jgi:regulator-associated protein of mTOR
VYFISILGNKNNDHKIRSMACFVLSVIVDRYVPGQRACIQSNNLLGSCITQLTGERDPLLRRWLLLLISKVIEGLYDAQDQALALGIHEKVARYMNDEIPEVRAAAVYCLASFISLPSTNVVIAPDSNGEGGPQIQPVMPPSEKSEQRIRGEMDVGIASFKAMLDGSPIVRRELVYALGVFLKNFGDYISPEQLKSEMDEKLQRKTTDRHSISVQAPPLSSSPNQGGISSQRSSARILRTDLNLDTEPPVTRDIKGRECGKISIFTLDMCRIIIILADDPMPMVSNAAQQILNYLKKTYLAPEGITTSSSSVNLSNLLSTPVSATSHPQILDLRTRGLGRDAPSRQRSPIRTPSPSTAAPPKKLGVSTTSRFFNMKKSASVPDFSSSINGDGQSTPTNDGTGFYEDDASIPESRFYEWSCEYFAKPMLPENKDDEEYDALMYEEEMVEEPQPTLTPSMSQQILQLKQEEEEELDQQQQLNSDEASNGSTASMKMLNSPRHTVRSQYVSPATLKRQMRNEQLVNDAHALGKKAGKRKLEEQIGFFGNDSDIVRKLRFHPFEPHLIVADENDGITVWNWQRGAKINNFHASTGAGPVSSLRNNSIIQPARITDLQILNDQSENSILLVSSAGGNVQLYKKYEIPDEQYLVSAIKVEPEAVAIQQGPGILTEWQQDHGLLYVAGDIPHIKVWDLERELCVQTFRTEIEACVTSLACDHVGGFSLVAGCSDGSVLIYDRRVRPEHAIVSRMCEHKNWVVNVCIQKVNTSQVISGSASGDIKFWDTRVEGASLKSFDIHKGSMTTLAVHDYAPVLACGSNDQFIKVFNTSGETLSMIYYHDGFLGQRIGPVSSLAFHPYRMCLAAGSTDSIISIYSGDSGKGQVRHK